MRAIPAALLILATLGCPPALAQQKAQAPLPKIVEDAIAENKKQCEDGQKVQLKPGFVTTRDINGDRTPDYILNYEHFQCGEFETLFCGTGGCLTEIFASTEDGYVNVWNKNARRIRFTVINKRPAMQIDLHGALCGRNGNERCAMTLYWNGQEFHPAN